MVVDKKGVSAPQASDGRAPRPRHYTLARGGDARHPGRGAHAETATRGLIHRQAGLDRQRAHGPCSDGP